MRNYNLQGSVKHFAVFHEAPIAMLWETCTPSAVQRADNTTCSEAPPTISFSIFLMQVGFHLEPHHHDTFKYLTLGLMDMDHEDLVKHFSQAFEFIDQGRAAGKYTAQWILHIAVSVTA